jgi:hypothetical protein
MVRSHTPLSLVETVHLDPWRSSSKDQGRRSWSHSAEEVGQAIYQRVQPPLVSNPSASAVWYPGAISVGHENPQLSRSVASPIPFTYVQRLPPAPRPAILRTSDERFSSNEFSRAHFTSRTKLPEPQSKLEAQRSGTSRVANVMPSGTRGGTSRYQKNRVMSGPPQENQEVRIRPQRPSISSFGTSDSQLLTDNTWQGMISYSRAL